MNESVLEEKLYFNMSELICSSKFDWGSRIISVGKSASKNIGVLIRSMRFLSPDVALHL